MFESILDYIISDMLLMAFATGHIHEAREHDPVNIPIISTDKNKMTGINFNTPNDPAERSSIVESFDKKGRFHSHRGSASVRFPWLEMKWGDDTTENMILHRDHGPAQIIFNNLQKWHRHGQLHRKTRPAIKADFARFTWYRHGEPYRKNGPFQVSLSNFEAYAEDGVITRFNSVTSDLNLDWLNAGGKRLPDSVVKQAYARLLDDDIQIDLLAADSVFESDMDSMMFWSDLR